MSEASEATETNHAAITSPWRRGWPVVLSGAVGTGCCAGLFVMSAGLFIAPMRNETGWTMTQAAFAPLVVLIISFMMPAGGWAADRYGARAVAIVGALVYGSAYLLFAALPLELFLIYPVAIGLGLLGPAGQSAPYLRGVATWFGDRVGAAFGATLTGTSLAGVICVPLVAAVIERWGWRAGYYALAAIVLLATLPLILWLFRERQAGPAEARIATASPAMSVRAMMADPGFWMLAAALAFAALPLGAYLAHLQPMLRDRGFSLEQGAAFGALFAGTTGLGRLLIGVLIDRIWPYGIAIAVLCIGAAGSFVAPMIAPSMAWWCSASIVAALGLAYGSELDFAAYFVLRVFGLASFSKVFGCIALVLGCGLALGGLMGSRLFDWTGSYALVGAVGGGCFLLSAFAMLAIGIRAGRPGAVARAT